MKHTKSSISESALIESYQRTRSVWKTAAEFGLCGQTVHERLRRIGANTPMHLLSRADKFAIIDLYSDGFGRGDGRLDELAARLGRTKQFVCRFAGKLGFTNSWRPRSQEFNRKVGDRVRKWIEENGHPRGALGIKHGALTRSKISKKSKQAWSQMSELKRAQRSEKILKSRLAKFGTLAPPRMNTSWKSGWREVSGQRLFFRSRWEFNYALYLEALREKGLIQKWEHEPETFIFGPLSYLPDFRVTPNTGAAEYREVKGWMDERSKKKLQAFRINKPGTLLRVIGPVWFKKHERILCRIVTSWEH